MERPLKVGLYSPFFGTTYGGGEKYLGMTAQVLRDTFPDAEVEIVSPVIPDVPRYETMMGLNLNGIRFRTPVAPGRLKRWASSIPTFGLYRELMMSARIAGLSTDYDLFISMVYVMPAFNRSRRGIIICQFPYTRNLPLTRRDTIPAPVFWLYSLPYRLGRKLILGGGIDDFQQIVCYSDFVSEWIQDYWQRDSVVVNPPIEIPAAEPDWAAKKPWIVSVGRFFTGGHSKRHDLMVEAFRNLCDAGLEGWELHLAGSVHWKIQDHVDYFERTRERARGYPVTLHPDAPREVVQDLYQRGSIYWHASGFGVNGQTHPAELEHFGMTTAEAMSHGLVPVVVGVGGQPEVIEEGISGFVWSDLATLSARTGRLISDPDLRRAMGGAARSRSRRFSVEEFRRAMIDVVRPPLEEIQAERAARSSSRAD
jgi:glycosyltransferase involved in cell wall biosynthesis